MDFGSKLELFPARVMLSYDAGLLHTASGAYQRSERGWRLYQIGSANSV